MQSAKIEEYLMRWIESGVLEVLWKVKQHPGYTDAIACVQQPKVVAAMLTAAHHIREQATELSWRRYELGVQPLNHRHFFVGGVAVGLVRTERHGLYDWWVSAAWNTKPQPGDDKYCSEQRLGKRAIEARCRCLVAVAIVGERNDDSRSGVSYATLEPCERCRDDMRGKFHSIYRKDTRIVMQNPLNARLVQKSVTQLMRGHGESWP